MGLAYIMDVHTKGPLFSIGAFSLFFDPLLAELCLDPLFGGLFAFCYRGGAAPANVEPIESVRRHGVKACKEAVESSSLKPRPCTGI